MQPIPTALLGWWIKVSVSTSGSKGVQLKKPIIPMIVLNSFSIHKRIEGGATTATGNWWRQPETFQYPQADRRGCNTGDGNRQPETATFQYPQADRRGCNSHFPVAFPAFFFDFCNVEPPERYFTFLILARFFRFSQIVFCL